MYGHRAWFAILSLLGKYSCLTEGAQLALSRCPGGERAVPCAFAWDTGTPEEVQVSLSPGRKRLFPSLRVVALWLHFVCPSLCRGAALA